MHVFLPVYLCLSVGLPVFLLLSKFVYLPVCVCFCVSAWLSVFLFLSFLSVCLFFCRPVCTILDLPLYERIMRGERIQPISTSASHSSPPLQSLHPSATQSFGAQSQSLEFSIILDSSLFPDTEHPTFIFRPHISAETSRRVRRAAWPHLGTVCW